MNPNIINIEAWDKPFIHEDLLPFLKKMDEVENFEELALAFQDAQIKNIILTCGVSLGLGIAGTQYIYHYFNKNCQRLGIALGN